MLLLTGEDTTNLLGRETKQFNLSQIHNNIINNHDYINCK